MFNIKDNFTRAIKKFFNSSKLDIKSLEDFRKLLLEADFGIEKSDYLINIIKKHKFQKDNFYKEVVSLLQKEIINLLSPFQKDFVLERGRLNVIIFVGINGAGKTTTIGKFANKYKDKGYKVAIAACDTFRAGAVQQVNIWAERNNVFLFKGEQNADPASVAYKAMSYAKEHNIDLLLIDTAGRLQNNTNLMNQLAKINKVIKKIDDSACHHSLLVLDSTNGRNMIVQSKSFFDVSEVNGIVLTKIDGSAKAGSILSIVDEVKIPIYFVANGESEKDLYKFSIEKYAKSIFQ